MLLAPTMHSPLLVAHTTGSLPVMLASQHRILIQSLLSETLVQVSAEPYVCAARSEQTRAEPAIMLALV